MKRILLPLKGFYSLVLLFFLVATACKKKTIPQVSTINVTEISKDSAKVNGVLISDGNLEIKELGVCWSKNPNPTIDSDKGSISFNGTSNFYFKISRLEYNTRYFAKVYAINKEGVSYGNEISFKTLDFNPDKMRKILVEVFTGHTNPNAEISNTKFKELKDNYGPKVVGMILHVSSTFAAPQLPGYPADYRTTAGTEIDDFFNVSSAGLPKGMINRKGFPSSNILSYQNWDAEISNIVNAPIEAWVDINNTYDAGLKKVTSEVKVNFEKNINDEIKLCVFLVEDSVISPQKDINTSGGIISNYAHMNMLRMALTPAFGETIASNPTTTNPQITKSYSITLSPENNQDHCKIIAYVYKSSNYEILQVQEKKVK
ncbi:MAG TPA: Omp28-related outer membrane protein [Bacteroidia bacterium]|nr:Omp28-related outer membrane protein [Bacteroidia bacterium]